MNEAVALSVAYLVELLNKRNHIAASPLWKHPFKGIRLLILNRRVRKAARLLRDVAEAAALSVSK